ncbi:galactosyl transferase GMA12/MNN10 family-domain-containing protein [Lipomyces kononenkoae]
MKLSTKFQLISAFTLLSIAALIYLSVPYYKNLESVVPWKERPIEVQVQEVTPAKDVEQSQNVSGAEEKATDTTLEVATPTEAVESAAEPEQQTNDATGAEPEKQTSDSTGAEPEKQTNDSTEQSHQEELDQSFVEQTKARLAELQGKARDTVDPKGNKVVLLTATDGKGHNGEIENLLEMVTENREEYCAFHEYKYQFTDMSQFNQEGRVAVWNKIPAIQNAFDVNPDAEWVWWLDMDAIIMTPAQDLASLVLNPDALKEKIAYEADLKINEGKPSGVQVSRDIDISKIDFIISQDHAGINAGSMLFRRSDWTFSFLDMWVDQVYVERFNNEQDALSHILVKHEKIRQHVGIVPQRVINAYGVGGEEMGWRTGDIVVHFAGCWVEHKCSERWQDFWGRRTVLKVPANDSPADAPEGDAPEGDAPPAEAARTDDPQGDAPDGDTPLAEAARADDPQGEAPPADASPAESDDSNKDMKSEAADGATDGDGQEEKKEDTTEEKKENATEGGEQDQ